MTPDVIFTETAAALASLVSAGGLLFVSKPQPDWAGSSAALFCAALLVGLSGATQLAIPGSEGQLLLEQLALFAAVPMISGVLLLNATSLRWDRPAWGRVLLGICAVFELARRSDVLHEWLITVVIVALGALATGIRKDTAHRMVPALLCWGGALGITLNHSYIELVPVFAAISVFFVNRQDIAGN